MSKKYIFNLEIDDISKEEFVLQISNNENYNFTVTPNLQHVVSVNQNIHFLNKYTRAAFTLCDSRILQKLSNVLNKPIQNVIAGSDLTKYLFEHVFNGTENIMIVGSSDRDIFFLKSKYQLTNLSHYSPPMGFINNRNEVEKTINVILDIEPRYLFLAVGFPRQEELAYILENKVFFPCSAFCIGASIDFLTGKQNRAPLIWQKARMEWLYRFFQEPKRMFKRYFIDSWRIIPILFKEKYRK